MRQRNKRRRMADRAQALAHHRSICMHSRCVHSAPCSARGRPGPGRAPPGCSRRRAVRSRAASYRRRNRRSSSPPRESFGSAPSSSPLVTGPTRVRSSDQPGGCRVGAVRLATAGASTGIDPFVEAHAVQPLFCVSPIRSSVPLSLLRHTTQTRRARPIMREQVSRARPSSEGNVVWISSRRRRSCPHRGQRTDASHASSRHRITRRRLHRPRP